LKEDKSEKRKSNNKSPMFKFWAFKKSGQNKQKGVKDIDIKGSDQIEDRANSADREPTGRKTGGF